MKEIEIGRDKLSLYDDAFDVTPFYPLLAFPDRDDKKFLQFEKRMIDAERRRNGQKITPQNKAKDIDFGFEAALAEIEGGNRSVSRRVTNREVSKLSVSAKRLDLATAPVTKNDIYHLRRSTMAVVRKESSIIGADSVKERDVVSRGRGYSRVSLNIVPE